MANKRVLVVDDDSSVTDLLQHALEEAGYEVDATSTAGEALGRIRDHLYDALILDFDLPDMSGVALHSEIRKIDEELAQRTLFISGLDQTDQRLDYYSTDGAGFLSKPFDVWEVTARIHKLTAVRSGVGADHIS